MSISPTDWGMCSKAGDRALTKKAESLLRKLEKYNGQGDAKILSAFNSYFKSFAKCSKTYPEARDTEVREIVWGFALDESKRFGIDYNTLDKIWYKHF